MIHRKIEAFDERATDNIDPSDDQIVSISTPLVDTQLINGSEHVSLGAPSPSVTIAGVEQWHVDDVVFMDFHKKIGKAFSNYFNENIRFNADDEVCFHSHSKSHWE